LSIALCIGAFGQDSIPTVDAEAGPCSVEFTAYDGSGHPVYGAQIQVHVDYGIFGLRQLDLQVGTDADGRARFEGLPDDTDGVLFFEANTDRLKGVAVYYPAFECRGRHTIFMAEQ
jgi:hypothetical protein